MTTETTNAAAAAPAVARVKRWDTDALHRYLTARMKMPFAWATNDCATFAADGILAMTGVDVAADFRGKYSDEASAAAAIAAVCGGKTVEDAAAWSAAKYGLAEWAEPLRAQRGDLAIVMNGTSPAAGLVHLNGSRVAIPGETGLVLFPVRKILRAWHVGPASTVKALGGIRA